MPAAARRFPPRETAAGAPAPVPFSGRPAPVWTPARRPSLGTSRARRLLCPIRRRGGGMVEASEGEEGEGRGPSARQGPRDRLLSLGASALSDQELVSLLLGAAGARGPPSASLPLAKWLLDTSGGLRALMLRDPVE